jgi:Predicted membrane protein (DUF2142)
MNASFVSKLRLRLLVIGLACVVVIVAWSIASPAGSTPDEAYHIGNAWCVFGESENCSILDSTEGGYRWAEIPYSVDLCFKKGPEVPATCIQDDHPKVQVVPIDNVSRMYPPHFYMVGNFFLSIFGTNGILALRIFNGLLFAVMLSLAISQGTRAVRTGLLLSSLIFLVPQGVFLVGSVNPSSWSFTGALTTWSFLASFLARLQDGRRNPAFVSLACWIVSLIIASARYDSMVFAVILSLAVTFSHGRWLWREARQFLAGSLAMTLLAMILARGFLLSIARRSVEMISDPGFFSFARYWLIHFIEIPLTSMGLNYGSYGPTGSLDVLTPPLVGHVQFGLLMAALIWSMRHRDILQRIFFSLFLLTLFVLILQEVSRSHETGFYVVQGRYFLPFVGGSVGIILAAAKTQGSLFDFPSLRTPLVALLTISHSLSIFSIIRRYSFGTTNDYKRFDINVDENFSLPGGWRYISFISPQLLFALGSVAFAVAAWLVVTMIMNNDHPQRPEAVPLP